jgi:hypothetical protein
MRSRGDSHRSAVTFNGSSFTVPLEATGEFPATAAGTLRGGCAEAGFNATRVAVARRRDVGSFMVIGPDPKRTPE